MKLKTFIEWRKQQEMTGVSTIVSKKDCHNPDFQVWGAFCNKQNKKNKGGIK